MLPMIKKKRADVMNAVMDQSAIGAAAVPQADRPKAPTLAGAQRPVPMSAPRPPAPQQAPRDPMAPVVQRGSNPIADRAQQRAAVGVAPGGTGFAPVTGAVGGGEGSGDFGSGTPKPFPTAPKQTPEQAAQSEQDKMDQEIRDFVRSRIGAAGKVDTTEEEALITRQMEGKLGEGLVDARARGGRAGFGMSGAQQAVEGDVRGAASRSALDQILGLRRGEEQRAIENATSAIGTEQGMRSAASADALRRMVLESLQADKGLEGEVPTTTDDMRNLSDKDYSQAAPPEAPDHFSGMTPNEKANVAAVRFDGDSVWMLDRNQEPPKLYKISRSDFDAMTGVK